MNIDLARPVITDLQPFIDAITASLREQMLSGCEDLSLTLEAADGRALVVRLQARDAGRSSITAFATPRLNGRRLRLVIDTIHEKIAEPLSVSMLSSVAGLSRSYFSHAFRASVGRTPHAHVVRLRIERAIKFMAETDMPLSEIALSTGFADQAHFSNAFRRLTGQTPKRWRTSRKPLPIDATI